MDRKSTLKFLPDFPEDDLTAGSLMFALVIRRVFSDPLTLASNLCWKSNTLLSCGPDRISTGEAANVLKAFLPQELCCLQAPLAMFTVNKEVDPENWTIC